MLGDSVWLDCRDALFCSVRFSGMFLTFSLYTLVFVVCLILPNRSVSADLSRTFFIFMHTNLYLSLFCWYLDGAAFLHDNLGEFYVATLKMFSFIFLIIVGLYPATKPAISRWIFFSHKKKSYIYFSFP